MCHSQTPIENENDHTSTSLLNAQRTKRVVQPKKATVEQSPAMKGKGKKILKVAPKVICKPHHRNKQGRTAMQSSDYKKTVDKKNDETRKELNILEDLWENHRDDMNADQKDLRFKLQRTISARESRLNKKQDETLYVEIIKN